jgi:hypothetical protein
VLSKRRKALRRRLLRLAGFASGALAGTLAYRRLFGDRGERLDVYFDDGSFVTFAAGSPEAERLLPVARQILGAARATGVPPGDRATEGGPGAARRTP